MQMARSHVCQDDCDLTRAAWYPDETAVLRAVMGDAPMIGVEQGPLDLRRSRRFNIFVMRTALVARSDWNCRALPLAVGRNAQKVAICSSCSYVG